MEICKWGNKDGIEKGFKVFKKLSAKASKQKTKLKIKRKKN